MVLEAVDERVDGLAPEIGRDALARNDHRVLGKRCQHSRRVARFERAAEGVDQALDVALVWRPVGRRAGGHPQTSSKKLTARIA